MDKALDNRLILLFAILILPTVTICVLSFSSWVGLRAIGTVDEHTKKLNAIELQLERNSQFIDLVTQKRNEEIQGIRSTIGDHEARIRVIEARR